MNPFCYIYMRGKDEALLRPEASWRRIIVSQPLVKAAEDGIKCKSEWPSVYVDEYMLTAATLKEGVGMWKKVYFADEVGLLRRPKAWRI
jgi:hypothetical protein